MKNNQAQIKQLKNFLFISGTPRSGTTVLTLLLSYHEKIALGIERYKYLYNKKNGVIDETYFSKEKFFDFSSVETNVARGKYAKHYQMIFNKWNQVEILGDKYPHLIKNYEYIERTFKDNFIFFVIFRNIIDVCSSWNVRAENKDDAWPEKNNYQAAVEIWNNYLLKTYALLRQKKSNIFIVEYERLFDVNHAKHQGYLESILNILNVDYTEFIDEFYKNKISEYINQIKNKQKNIKEQQNEYIEQYAEWNIYYKLIEEYSIQ